MPDPAHARAITYHDQTPCPEILILPTASDTPPVRIRVIKPLPAPLMDGFDVQRFRVNRVYDLDTRLANYLIVAGYAIVERPPTGPARSKKARRTDRDEK